MSNDILTAAKRRWQAITLATLLLVPAYWAMLAGAVTLASDDDGGGIPNPEAALALGLAVIPFVFVVLAFVSAQRNPPRAVLRAMGLSLVVGAGVSVLAGDAVSGLVAGVGAGGIVSLRLDPPATTTSRVVALAIAVAYVFVLARMASALALLPAPVFPLTAIGMADQLRERRADQAPAHG